MQCPNCNTQVNNNASFCPNCGYQLNNTNNMGSMGNTNNGMNINNGMNAPVQQNNNSSSSLLQVAFILNIITMVVFVLVIPAMMLTGSAIGSFVSVNSGDDTIGFATGAGFSVFSIILCFIPLAWMIPMTIYLNKIRKGQAEITTVYSVCTLFLVNVISGILLLVEQSHHKQ